MKEIVKILSAKAQRKGNVVFEDWLDFMIDLFDISHVLDFDNWARHKFREDSDYLQCAVLWLGLMTEKVERCENYDALGMVYEAMFQSKFKASTSGQFFTPDCLCSLMARITETDGGAVNDPACGSGRTFLGYRCQELSKGRYYTECHGQDIDPVSCKMCALNLMVYGCGGSVTQMDTLKYSGEWNAYYINEVRYPFPTTSYSIRRGKRIIEPPQSAENGKEVQVTAPKPKQAPKAEKQAVQLSLF